ncbi:uncharacterized protein FMAN_15499 [Fusarium mangiferae]|uniref:RNase H type-1 domain-containing protein n=1 Tax=Fusarium mangiferae TaxID=192010 RepID=A0A1L7UML9_FUSMA|nr:uncharacterized protein FMAN_15499 [Fusarium mangiferae]CVL09335.1 uncharacterized protein FMAN_15499 [Fusarium mangiferae]
MHFSRSNLRVAPSICYGDTEKFPESALRWLGIWLDSRLSFRVHVEKWAAKAHAVAYHLRGLANTIHCPLPSAVRSAVMACVEPTASKERAVGAFLSWVKSLDSLTLVVYSDGSLSEKGVASYGFTIHQDNLPIFDGSGRLGPAEVFDAEARGALEGLKAALNLRESAKQTIFICLDNLAAATCLQGTRSDSSQDLFPEFQALATLQGSILVRWVPGHTESPGNEQADKLAKAASSLPEPEGAQPTLAYPRRFARQKFERNIRGVVAARRSYGSREQLCTIYWQRDHFTGTSPHITRYSTITTHAWSTHVVDAKHQITSSTAERYRRVIG